MAMVPTMTAVVFDDLAGRYGEALRARFPEVNFQLATDLAQAIAAMHEADALFALAPRITDALIAAGGRLRWIQALTSGVDNLARLPSLDPGMMITTTRGIHGPQMSEMAIMLMLALSRDLPRVLRNQNGRRWERWPQRMLWQRTVTIVGIGTIAEALCERCRALGLTVLGVSGSARAVPGFDRVWPRTEVAAAVATADYVVVLTPYSADTHHLIDAAVLAAMRPDSYLINIARGGVVDETALLAALNAHTIQGAALDVFEHEPLPEDSPWWTAPNTIVVPHLGGMSEGYERQVLPILEHNLTAFLRGDHAAMSNRVDLTKIG